MHYRSSRCRLYLCMISFMVFIALSVVCATFLFRNSFHFHPKDYELNRGEMRVVEVSTLFCEGIVVKPRSFKRQVVVISHPLARRAAQRKIMSTDDVFLRRDHSWYRSFYLLKGSIVSVRIASRHSLNVYWLRGRKVLDKWSDEMSKDLKESSKQNTDKFTATSMAETFTVNEDKNYYLGITSIAGNTEYSEIFVNVSVHHMLYDVGSYVTSCNASIGESCEVKLRFNLPDTAVIMVPNNTTLPEHDVWVSWYCKPRIWFYTVVFGGGFLFVVLLMNLLYCCIMSRVRKKVRKWKPHVVAVRKQNKENGGVTLTSINVRGSTLDDNCENSLELTPLRLTPASDETRDTCQENNKPDMPCHSTPNGVNSVDAANSSFSTNGTRLTLFDDANYVDFATKPVPDNATPWRSPTPRWSTFLSADDYEECVTNFRESPNNTLHSIEKESEDENFESQLMDRLQNTEIDQPIETDIDNVESETQSLLNDAVNDDDVVMRQKEKRKEQRWEPRLSVVTEI